MTLEDDIAATLKALNDYANPGLGDVIDAGETEKVVAAKTVIPAAAKPQGAYFVSGGVTAPTASTLVLPADEIVRLTAVRTSLLDNIEAAVAASLAAGKATDVKSFIATADESAKLYQLIAKLIAGVS